MGARVSKSSFFCKNSLAEIVDYWFRGSLKLTGLALFVVYLAWNAWWLSQLQVPPALIKGFTSFPAPTTGGTRSFMALLGGDWKASLYYNPMTVFFLGALVATFVCLIRSYIRNRKFRLGQWAVFMWGGLLSVAWVIKLLSPVQTW